MGKVKIIQKSRKDCKCNRCGKEIPVGSKYYRGTLNFRPDIVRCEECGLQSWEVTTSEYQLAVGELSYRWQENYGTDCDVVDSIVEDLETIRDDVQERLDNMPENLQDSETGTMLQDRIDCVESVISDLESIDVDDLKQQSVSEVLDYQDDDSEPEDYDVLVEDESFEKQEELSETLKQHLIEEIDNALGGLEV